MRNFAVPAVVLATFYVACADPPKKVNHNPGGAGIGGAIDGVGGGSEDAGASPDQTGGTSAAGTSASSSGKGGKSGGPADPQAGAGGEAGTSEAEGGEGGVGPQGGMGGSLASGGHAGTGGAPSVDNCTTPAPTTLPVPPSTGVVAKPSGVVGGLKVVNWAGFKGAISYTFDDSLASQVTHYAELNAVGIPMTFYVVCGNSGANPVWTKAATDGHELGNHTYHHCKADGTLCSFGGGAWWGVDREIDDCTAYMKSTFGVKDVYTFAAPNGDGGWADPASARFMSNRGVSDFSVFPNDSTTAYGLPCHLANEGETATGTPVGFNAVTDDARSKGSWRIILAHNVDPTIMDYGYHPVQVAEVVATMNYTKGLGDVWADTVVSIGSYWLGQRALNNLQPVTSGTDKVYTWTLPAHFPPGHRLRVTVTGGKVKQCGSELPWNDHGYYEINLDAGSLTVSP